MLRPVVSIIIPLHNAEPWLEECLASVSQQSYEGPMEVCVYDDASTDRSIPLLHSLIQQLHKHDVKVTLTASEKKDAPRGCGFAKNRAVESSCGEYLCFLDADDVMDRNRVQLQLQTAKKLPIATIIGCQVTRKPSSSTPRYTKWINNLDPNQLYTQVYTSNGPTIVMPTWFCHRKVFDMVGGFHEGGHGIPEDYIFFLRFIELGGGLHRVDEVLMMYRHHPQATTFSVLEETIWKLRLQALEKNVLHKWSSFTIWNAGKQGRKLYRDLSDKNRSKVSCFCDVDCKKIKLGVYVYELSPHKPKPKIPIVHFRDAPKPFIVCVKMDMTGGVFEENLNSLQLIEGEDYVLFS